MPKLGWRKKICKRGHDYAVVGKWGSRCKACERMHQRNRIATKRQEVYALRRVRVAALQAEVNRLKSGPCTDCQRSFPPICMDFDHVRGVKRGKMSELVSRGVSFDTLYAEINKCDIVCACCHRIRHGKD